MPVGPGSLHVERYGLGGQAVLLVHGFGTNSFVWRNVGPSIALANLTAFAVDMFGYGASDRPFDADYGIAAAEIARGLPGIQPLSHAHHPPAPRQSIMNRIPDTSADSQRMPQAPASVR